jgi:hypothetical protein
MRDISGSGKEVEKKWKSGKVEEVEKWKKQGCAIRLWASAWQF